MVAATGWSVAGPEAVMRVPLTVRQRGTYPGNVRAEMVVETGG
jgi:hypothetical protein